MKPQGHGISLLRQGMAYTKVLYQNLKFSLLTEINCNKYHMNKIYLEHIKNELSIALWQVENCISLIEEGSTIPFISRYRKERTGGLDEVQVAEVKHFFNLFVELEKRKGAILKSISEQDKLTPELEKEIEECIDSNRLEDIYLPYKPKRRTKASIAKEKGLEPLALALLEFKISDIDREAQKYFNEQVADTEEALQGARDIIAEMVSETPTVREALRTQYSKYAKVVTKQQRGLSQEDEQSSKYRNYFEFTGNISNIPSHRLLALLRGANEGHLSIKLDVDESYSLKAISREIVGAGRVGSKDNLLQVESAIADSYKRLLHPSIENEAFRMAKERADRDAVKVFGENLTALLLAAPVGQKRVLAIDPGYRTGCKVVCLDAKGELLHNDTI
ncbi:MAG: hypothetical protein EOM16_05280, partial [Bacteroidia bacterium]|nr:hypothetical protein [Bacteroidia bacterium]